MKNKKCALGLVAMLAVAAGLASCDQVTSNTNGSIFTYTDSQGNRISYTAEDLLNDYRKTGSSLSTEFDKVYEVLVRHYYNDSSKATELSDLKADATQDVADDKAMALKNAGNNTTTYEAELEKIMTNHNCENADDLFQYHLYQREKDKFQNSIYQTYATDSADVNGIEAMRDGQYTLNGTTTKIMQGSTEWGIGNDGWLKEQMPYHTRHILVKIASGTTGSFLSYTEDKISQAEATKLGSVVLALAGGQYSSTLDDAKKVIASSVSPIGADNRATFGSIAYSNSDDSSSAAYYGEPVDSSGKATIVTKVMDSDFVHEYKLGMYAYESLYNTRETATAYGSANAYRIAPGLSESATSMDPQYVDATQTLDDANNTKVYDFFKDYTYKASNVADFGTAGIGQIPFGAAVALLDHASDTKDSAGNTVNKDADNYENFYPRNVLFNKYFNRHNVCVITPNAVWSNAISTDATTRAKAALCADQIGLDPANPSAVKDSVVYQDFLGKPTAEYASLPGFQKNTVNILPQFPNNVLTDESGNVVLAVKASSSNYQGVHFIVVQRSALSQYGISYNTATNAYEESSVDASANGIPTLSQYYTTYTPGQSDYPTYQNGSSTKNMSTFINYNKQMNTDFSSRAGIISSGVKSYNSNLSTYQFEMLVSKGSITFQDSSLKGEMQKYTKIKRQSSIDTAFTTWAKNWKEYAEVISSQDQARNSGLNNGKGTLLSESVAVDFNNPATRNDVSNPDYYLWQQGGACYGSK